MSSHPLRHSIAPSFTPIGTRAPAALIAIPRKAVASARAWRRTVDSDWPLRYRARLWISDSAVVIASVWCAALFPITPAQAIGTATAWDAAIPLLLIVAWLGALSANRTRDVRVIGTGLTEYRRVVQASIITFGLIAIAFQALDIRRSPGFFVVVLVSGLSCLLIERRAWRGWISRRRLAGDYLSSAIVVGSRSDVSYVLEQIRRNPGAGYRVDGVALDDATTGALPGRSAGIRIVAGLADAALAARTMEVDAVVVAGHPRADDSFIKDLAWQLEGTRAELVLASRLADVAGPRIHFRPVEGLPLVHVELPQYEGGKHFVKRVFDASVAAIAIVILLPLFAAIAIAIRRESSGPVLFSQQRVGRGGRSFRMFKYRSMVVDAEAQLDGLREANQGAGALFKLRDDPRVTRVGKVLRKYSLDELPQLFNVLVGDMSLVGPRPPLQSEVEEYERHVRRRLFIKPGLTGMWQVNGRSDLDWEESVRLDLYYVENWSLTGDLLILWRTARVVLNGSGAY